MLNSGRSKSNLMQKETDGNTELQNQVGCVWVVLRIWDFYVTADMSVLLFLLLLSTQVSLIRRALRRASVSRFRQDCKIDS